MNGFALMTVLALTAAMADAYSIAVTDANSDALSYQNGQFYGSLAPLYQCSLDTLDQPFSVSTLPQVRALRMLETYEIDMVVPLAQSVERDQFAHFASPLLTLSYFLFTLPGIDEVPENDPDFKIAVTWSSASINLIEALGHEVIPVDHHELAIGMVKRERAHGAVIPEPIAAAMPEYLKGLARHDYASLPAGAYVNSQNTELQQSFDSAIQTCRQALL